MTFARLVSDIPEMNDKGISFINYPSGHSEMCVYKPFEGRRGGRRKAESRESQDDVVIEAALRRSRRVIRQSCLAINADRLLTLTYRINQMDLDLAWKDFKYFLQLCRRHGLSFEYVCVPERQKRGAIHFHLAINKFLLIKKIQFVWNQVLKAHHSTDGNVDVTSPEGRKHGAYKSYPSPQIAEYISKYISKESVTEFGRRRYRKSKGIELKKKIVYLSEPPHEYYWSQVFEELTGRIPCTHYRSSQFNILFMTSWDKLHPDGVIR